MQVNAVSITAKFVQMDIEIEGGPIEVDDYDFNHTRPSRPPRVGFLVSLVSQSSSIDESDKIKPSLLISLQNVRSPQPCAVGAFCCLSSAW